MYRIGSFNVLNMNFRSEDEEKKDWDTFARIIKENFDVVGLQEVLTESAVKQIVLKLNRGVINWDYCWHETHREGYAFIWNMSKLVLPPNVQDNPKIASGYHYKDLGGLQLVRPPLIIRLQPVNPGEHYELRLINTHIRFGKNSLDDYRNEKIRPDDEEKDPTTIQLRRNEHEFLCKRIYRSVESWQKTDNESRPAYTFLLGDYNLNIRQGQNPSPYLSEVIEIKTGVNINAKIVTRQSHLTTIYVPTENEKENNPRFAKNYDHFSYDLEYESSMVVTTNRINTVDKYFGSAIPSTFRSHKKTVSDHVPVVMEFNVRKR